MTYRPGCLIIKNVPLFTFLNLRQLMIKLFNQWGSREGLKNAPDHMLGLLSLFYTDVPLKKEPKFVF